LAEELAAQRTFSTRERDWRVGGIGTASTTKVEYRYLITEAISAVIAGIAGLSVAGGEA
jgi:hypothetical protein